MSNRAVFLDRDGIVIRDTGYLGDPDLVELLPDAAQAIKSLNEAGYRVAIVTNQSGVARGYFTEETLGRINRRLNELLEREGARLDGIYYCPHHPQAEVEAYRRDCDCRKPKPGLIFKAAKDLNADLKNSYMIGHEERDIEAGHRAGCKTILVATPPQAGQAPNKVVAGLREAAEWILAFDRD
ncbi:MAG: HAD family hydrolase [Actinomycetota bacterium]|nr:HAD family hydrolase [Actinomycetota bacterium]